MAYNIHWQCKFQSFEGTQYVVNIYDSATPGAGWPAQLTGAAKPFVTQEDDDPDIFKPVRTQSGYLSFFDDGAVDWTDIIPKTAVSRPVRLYQGNTLLWQGYLQPRTFSGELFGGEQIRKFPICCPLSALGSIDAGDFGESMPNFAGLILDLVGELGGDMFWPDGFYFGGGDGVTDWLYKRVNIANFYATGEDGISRSQYTALDLLEEVCKFWGWSCRLYKNDLYFTSPDAAVYHAWVHYDFQALDEVSSGDHSAQYSTYDWAQASLDGNVFATDDNEEEMIPGCRKAVVRAKVNKYDGVVSVSADTVGGYLDTYSDPINHITFRQDLHYFERVNNLSQAVRVSQGLGLIRVPGKDCTIEIDVDMSTQTPAAYGFLVGYYIYNGLIANLHDIPFTHGLLAKYNQLNTQVPEFSCFRVVSKRPINIDNGVLVIQATTCTLVPDFGTVDVFNGYCDCWCMLKVGDKYWTGTGWSSNYSEYRATFGGTEWAQGQGSIPSNRTLDQTTWTSPYPNYGGYGAPVDTPLSGTVTFAVMQVEQMQGIPAGNQQLIFLDLKMQFLRSIAASPYKDASENQYDGHQTNVFPKEVGVDTIFATDNGNAAGYGIIMNEDGTYCSEVEFVEEGGSYTDHVEQYVADRISWFGRKLRRKVTGCFRSSEIPEITPLKRCGMDGSTYYPVSISRDWGEDETTLTIIEL